MWSAGPVIPTGRSTSRRPQPRAPKAGSRHLRRRHPTTTDEHKTGPRWMWTRYEVVRWFRRETAARRDVVNRRCSRTDGVLALFGIGESIEVVVDPSNGATSRGCELNDAVAPYSP